MAFSPREAATEGKVAVLVVCFSLRNRDPLERSQIKETLLWEYVRNEKETEFQGHPRGRAVIELVLRSAEGRSWLQGHSVDPRGKN